MTRIPSNSLSPLLTDVSAQEQITSKSLVAVSADELQVIMPSALKDLVVKNKRKLFESEKRAKDDVSLTSTSSLTDSSTEAMVETENLAIVVTDNKNINAEDIAETVVDMAVDAGVEQEEMQELVLVEVAVDDNLNLVNEDKAEKTVWLVMWGSVIEDMVYGELPQVESLVTSIESDLPLPSIETQSSPILTERVDNALEQTALMPLISVMPNINPIVETETSASEISVQEQTAADALMPSVISAQTLKRNPATSHLQRSRSLANWLVVSLVSRQAWVTLDRFFLNKKEDSQF